MDIILLPAGGITRIARDLKVHRKTVGEALSGKTDTNLAKVIRKKALELPGARSFTEISKTR